MQPLFELGFHLPFIRSQPERMSTTPNSQEADFHEQYDVKSEYEVDVFVDPYSEDTFPDGGLRAWLVICGVNYLFL